MVLLELAIVLIVIIVGGLVVIIYNNLVRLNRQIDQAWANMEVVLKQRADELTKLMATVKGYMKYEKGVLGELTRARSAWMNASTMKEKATADHMLSGALKTLFAVSENYPKLSADQGFLQLQNRISGLENEIADRREFYNDAVTVYNIRIHTIPDMMFAGMLGYKDRELFKVSPAEMRDVVIDLDVEKK